MSAIKIKEESVTKYVAYVKMANESEGSIRYVSCRKYKPTLVKGKLNASVFNHYYEARSISEFHCEKFWDKATMVSRGVREIKKKVKS